MPQTQRRNHLTATPAFWAASETDRRANCNGCGQSWGDVLVPDAVYGLNISAACCIHDWMYAEGVTADDKSTADDVFLTNMMAIIEHASSRSLFAWLLAPLRRRRCLAYYEAVRAFGGNAFLSSELIRESEDDPWQRDV